MNAMDLFGKKANKVRAIERCPLGWGPQTLEGRCPHCGLKIRMYYSPEVCSMCHQPVEWEVPRGYKINK